MFVESREELLPYAAVVPYSTLELEASEVVQEIVAMPELTPEEETLEVTGAVRSNVIVTEEVAKFPA